MADETADPVAPHAERIIRHMRAEHLGDLLDMVKVFGGVDDATEADMHAIDRFGVDARVQTPAGERIVRIPYDEPATEGGQVREILTRMTHAARAALGKS
jgi:putative heme iron utilization protein